MELRVLAVGDVVGDGGLQCLEKHLRSLKKLYRADFCVVNGENASGTGLTPRQAEAVDVQKILRLFASPLGKTLLSAKTLRHEFKFSILTDAEAYSPEAAGEQVMLQGVVDCFWQEPDGIVILDFKTDYIDGDLQKKAERYAPQLHAYAAALSRIFQTPVKKTILYFFSANQPIEI